MVDTLVVMVTVVTVVTPWLGLGLCAVTAANYHETHNCPILHAPYATSASVILH